MNSIYLDIETRAFPRLQRSWQYITVVGFYHEDTGLVQLLWPDITAESLLKSLPPAERIFTFNGNSFDLTVIRQQLELNLMDKYQSHDLMYDCWSRGLRGGLKAVERRLGIARAHQPLSNYQIQHCWSRWKHNQDEEALRVLLKYNEEDVMNLIHLRKHLGV